MPSGDEVRRSDFRCWVKIPVQWGDMDALGHVNHAVYFTYCEAARIEYFDQIGYFEQFGRGRFLEAPEGPALAPPALNFRRQGRHPAVVVSGRRVPAGRARA